MSQVQNPSANGQGGNPEAVAPVGDRPRQYLVATSFVVPEGMNKLVLKKGTLLETLKSDPAVQVERTIIPPLAAQSLTPSPLDEVIVATMSAETAAQLETHEQVVLEEDELIRPVLLPTPPLPPDATDPSSFIPFGVTNSWSIALRGSNGEPVADAAVYLYGSTTSTQATTDATGAAQLSLLNETDDSIRALYVNPRSGYWSLWLDRPSVISGKTNVFQLTELSATFANFPNQQMIGWGQHLMRMDQIPPNLTGTGIKIAVIDSGAAVRTHPDLQAVTNGQDMTGDGGASAWKDDLIAHGSHCTGVISGADNATGIRGFAPGATVHELRVFPGGRLSSLLDALDYCLANDIDVVNMSLGGGGTSPLVLQKLNQARQKGIACIVAAGNTAGPVSFPGVSPDVLTVAAMGKLDEYPANSYQAKQQWKDGVPVGNLFSAQFTCHGPEVDVCAPGVAIVSAVPNEGYASWDGTSMAAPHVSGLSALVLAHHPSLQGASRDASRVDRLFQIIKSSAKPLDVGDNGRTGAGVPDALVALGLEPQPDGSSEVAISIKSQLDSLRKKMVTAGLNP